MNQSIAKCEVNPLQTPRKCFHFESQQTVLPTAWSHRDPGTGTHLGFKWYHFTNGFVQYFTWLSSFKANKLHGPLVSPRWSRVTWNFKVRMYFSPNETTAVSTVWAAPSALCTYMYPSNIFFLLCPLNNLLTIVFSLLSFFLCALFLVYHLKLRT